MKKIAYIIPGSGESTKEIPYKRIAAFFRKRGFIPKSIEVQWNYRVMSDYIQQFKDQVKVREPEVVLGYSFGAMIALLSYPEVRPKKLLLCSLSPYFKEDLSKLKKSWRDSLGKRLFHDLSHYSFASIAPLVTANTLLLVGEKEDTLLLQRVQSAKENIMHGEIKEIKKTKHDISSEEYLKAIQDVLDIL